MTFSFEHVPAPCHFASFILFAATLFVPDYGAAQDNYNPPILCNGVLLSVGVRDDASNLSGDTEAWNVALAFANSGVASDGGAYPWLALNSSDSGNLGLIQSAVSTDSEFEQQSGVPTQNSLFIFYINAHGYVLNSGVNPPKSYNLSTGPAERPATGDSSVILSPAAATDLTSTQLASMFSGAPWSKVSKLFIIDTCYAGGMWDDLNGLKNLPHTAIIAASDPLNVSWSNNVGGVQLGILGQTVTQVLQSDANLQTDAIRNDLGYMQNPGPGIVAWANDLIFDVISQETNGLQTYTGGRLETDPYAPFDSGWNADVPINEQFYTAESSDFLVPVAPVPGDFNGDGAVDTADYIYLRKQYPDITAGPGLTAYETWRTNFGRISPGSGASAVPEPAALVLLMISATSIGASSRGSRRG